VSVATKPALREATAWDLIGFQGVVRVKGGRAVYEEVIFIDGTRQEKVRLARLDVDELGLKQVNRYVDPDTTLEVLEEEAMNPSPADELLIPGGEVGPDEPAARWAYYRIGAFMAPTDTGRRHGPIDPDVPDPNAAAALNGG
jgi:hypothetical protein